MGHNGLKEILQYIPETIRQGLEKLDIDIMDSVQEIRMRRNKPLMIVTDKGDYFVDSDGSSRKFSGGYIIGAREIDIFFHILTKSSLYSYEEEIKKGYITLPGGHRVGLVGQVVMQKDEIQTIKKFTGFNIRISKEVLGASKGVLKFIVNREEKRVYHTLLISPPKGGKTTILRDLARELSNGYLNLPGQKVSIIDERSEIASCYNGIPQMDVGVRTDVLDGCPKAQGMMMVLRTMSPDIILTDELGRPEDVAAVREVLNCGVKIIASAHGNSFSEVIERPCFTSMVREKIFERYIILSSRKGPGTIEGVLDKEGKRRI